MATSLPPTAAAAVATFAPADDFDQRWSAWQARGAAHERRVHRRMAVALPILLAVAIVLFWSLVR